MVRQEHRVFEVLTLGEPMILLQPDAPASLDQASSLSIDIAGPSPMIR